MNELENAFHLVLALAACWAFITVTDKLVGESQNAKIKAHK